MRSKPVRKYVIKGRYFSSLGEIAEYYNEQLKTIQQWVRRKVTCEGDTVRTVRILT